VHSRDFRIEGQREVDKWKGDSVSMLPPREIFYVSRFYAEVAASARLSRITGHLP
jgi:hypothetical protein